MKKYLLGLGIIIVAVIGWYALSPLFIVKHIDEALPVTPTAPLEATHDTPSPETEPLPLQNGISAPVPIVDTLAHPASGFVRVVKNNGVTFVRYEDYKTINGPDIRVYLAKDLDAKEFVDLGPVKGTEGNINYAVPKEVALDDYRYVLTWCEDFSVLFNSADLSLIQ